MKPEVLAPLARDIFENATAEILLIHYIGSEEALISSEVTYNYHAFYTPPFAFKALYEDSGATVTCPKCKEELTVAAPYYEFLIISFADSIPALRKRIRKAYISKLIFYGFFVFLALLGALIYFDWPESSDSAVIGKLSAVALGTTVLIQLITALVNFRDQSNYLVPAKPDLIAAYPDRAVRVPEAVGVIDSDSEHAHFLASEWDAVGTVDIQTHQDHIVGWRALGNYFFTSDKVSEIFEQGDLRFVDRGKIPSG